MVLLRVSGEALRHHWRHLLRVMGGDVARLRPAADELPEAYDEQALPTGDDASAADDNSDDGVASNTTVRRLRLPRLALRRAATETGGVTQWCSNSEVLSTTEPDGLARLQRASTGAVEQGALIVVAAPAGRVIVAAAQALRTYHSGATQRCSSLEVLSSKEAEELEPLSAPVGADEEEEEVVDAVAVDRTSTV